MIEYQNLLSVLEQNAAEIKYESFKTFDEKAGEWNIMGQRDLLEIVLDMNARMIKNAISETIKYLHQEYEGNP